MTNSNELLFEAPSMQNNESVSLHCDQKMVMRLGYNYWLLVVHRQIIFGVQTESKSKAKRIERNLVSPMSCYDKFIHHFYYNKLHRKMWR